MNIAVIGVGTVGLGVVNLLLKQKIQLEEKIGEPLNLKWLCDREEVSELPEGSWKFTSDYKDILSDVEVDTVIELIGGNTVAYDIAVSALNNGKNLITANKHLLATKGKELFELAAKNNSKIFYEASVAGGIPVVSSLYEGLFPSEILSIRGILNGTANYILSEMEKGLGYDQALSSAQEKGYAEADPTFDIKGVDTGHKINLLSYLAWNELLDFDNISIVGIDTVTLEDVNKAKASNKRIKLIGEAKLVEGKVSVSVSPMEIEEEELLYNVMDCYNAVEIDSLHLGKTILYGAGAGMYPTASAVVSDLYKLVNSKTWH